VTTYTISLENAYLCSDCNRIGECSTHCPSCASRHGMMSLASVLNRSTEEDVEELETLLKK